MLKYLLLAVAVVWLFYSPALRGLRQNGKAAQQPRRPDGQAGQQPHVERMIQCAHCGVHLPRGEAVTNPQGQVFCSAAHLQAGPRRR
ncbi:MAG: PP0621 family protein [Aquabacterium sp.]